MPDEALGELLVGCIVPAEGVDLSAAAVLEFARERLASYKVPRRILFLAETELHMTGSGKIKPAELRALVMKRLAASGDSSA